MARRLPLGGADAERGKGQGEERQRHEARIR